MEGKLYPAVSVDIKMIGSRVSTKFWNTRKEDFAFQNDLTSPETFKLPVLSRSPIPILAGPGESDRDSDDISMKEEES